MLNLFFLVITVIVLLFKVNLANAYTQVESEDYRVFMINAYSGTARQIICEV